MVVLVAVYGGVQRRVFVPGDFQAGNLAEAEERMGFGRRKGTEERLAHGGPVDVVLSVTTDNLQKKKEKKNYTGLAYSHNYRAQYGPYYSS